MKKYLIAALIMMVGASFSTADAAKKDKKKKAEEAAVEAPVVLSTPSDSVSYAAGYTMTNGLMSYLQQRYQFDEKYMDDFLAGFKEDMEKGVDPHQEARFIASQIVKMVNERMLPNAKQDFSGTPDSITTAYFTKGFVAALKGDSTHFRQADAEKFYTDRREGTLKRSGEVFLAENAKKDGVKVTPSGLQYKVIKQGTGAVPAVDDEVKVNYEGRLIDGTVFDSSYKRGEPTKFKANQVIKGWTEALTMMPVGSEWELYIPYDLAYGERGAGNDIKPYAALIFKVELLDIVKPEVKPEAKPAETKPATKSAAATKKPASKKK